MNNNGLPGKLVTLDYYRKILKNSIDEKSALFERKEENCSTAELQNSFNESVEILNKKILEYKFRIHYMENVCGELEKCSSF